MEQITFGNFGEGSLTRLLKDAPALSDFSARIDFLSKQFLGVPYKESTLIGDANRAEVLVINLKELDCFTFLDYVEAMRVSNSSAEFKDHLVQIRYQGGEIAFEKRNHFFTDWNTHNPEYIEDVTEEVAGGTGVKVLKHLNRKDDGSRFLDGVPCREREIVYVPSEGVDGALISRLQTGDYIGIYTEQKGLDVSHVGIFIRRGEGGFLRHASWRYRKVVDEDFRQYINDKPGIIVLRPKDLPADQG